MASKVFTSGLETIARIGADSGDNEEIQLNKTLLVFSTLMIATLSVFWGAIYVAFGEVVSGSIPWGYSVLSLISLAVFSVTRRYSLFRFSQLLLTLILPFLLMLSLGGFVLGSAVILWSFTSPVGSLLFSGRRETVGWFVSFLALVALSGMAEPYLQPANRLPSVMITVFFALNIFGTLTVVFLLMLYFARQRSAALELLGREKQVSEDLLLNILPQEIAEKLKSGSGKIADRIEGVSILFADVVGFTPMSASMTPEETVDLLNEVFSLFDSLAEKYEVEKIKTIGDCYMAAAGVPRARPDHAHMLVRLALEILDKVKSRKFGGHQLSFRIGIDSGAVVAGVIGRKKFIYDLWGDAVNTASRMESQGVEGAIQTSRAVYELIKDEFECVQQNSIDVKGKGEMDVWHVVGEKPTRSE